MEYIKTIIVCLITASYILPTSPEIPKKVKDSAFQGAARELHTGLKIIVDENKEALADLGKNFGAGTVTLIGAGMVHTGASIKAAALAAAAFTPHIAAGGLTISLIYGGYKLYRHKYPTDEEKFLAIKTEMNLLNAEKELEVNRAQKDLTNCFLKNKNTEIAPSGRPACCEDSAFKFAMIAGKSNTLDEMTKLDLMRN